jgi:hypothetical protein
VGFVINATKKMAHSKFSQDIIVRLVDVCILSIQTSLSVVADVKEGETLQGMENTYDFSPEITSLFLERKHWCDWGECNLLIY